MGFYSYLESKVFCCGIPALRFWNKRPISGCWSADAICRLRSRCNHRLRVRHMSYEADISLRQTRKIYRGLWCRKWHGVLEIPATACCPCLMKQDYRERGRWLARNVLPHEALIRSKLRAMCLYDLDIEDVLQEMYARFMTHATLDAIRFPRQYALLVARGIIVDHVRHSRVVSITSSGNLELLEIAEPEANSEERMEFQQEVRVVLAALDALPKLGREILILRRVEGLPQKEVAFRLQISEKTVEKHMANGVRLLIKLFGRGGNQRTNPPSTSEAASAEDVVSKPRD